MGIYIGKVIDINDDNGGGRIKVRIEPDDNSKSDGKVDYAFPLLPKVIGIKPKLGEFALVLTTGDNANSQRYYIGPIISQAQNFYKNSDKYSVYPMLKGGRGYVEPNIDRFYSAKGAFAEDDETALYGRKNADIIISDNDIRIRCGCRVIKPLDTEDKIIAFNKQEPSFIKLNYYETPITFEQIKANGTTVTENVKSTTNIVGHYVNILSTAGDPHIDNIPNKDDKLISDETIKEILEKASPLPYGDKLVEFLQAFVNAFNEHTHKYHNLPPCPSATFKALGVASENLYDTLLSKHIRIN